ncbi:MAG: alpha/beta fold hydrolase [Gemmatimonadetes bacterium]|nr:alpha/beta fold hydrolase [Gemmatimonadota bacterium]
MAVGGPRLFVHAEGDGPPVLVVHGGPVLDHGYMVAPLRPLADGHRLIFFDQRLSGRSDGTVDSASVRLDTLVADMEGIRSALGLERIHVLGHSWGGLLAMKYALAHPERTASLVLVSPMAPSATLWQEEEAILSAALQPQDTAGMGALRVSAAFADGAPEAIERLLQLSFRAQLADPSLADSLRFRIGPDYRERSRQFGFLVPDLMGYDLTPALPGLRVPTLIVYGTREAGAAAGADSLRALIPGARIEALPAAGHFAFVEQPAAFLALVRAFLADCCG